MRTTSEIESDRAQAAYWILRARTDAITSGCHAHAVDVLIGHVLLAVRDATIRESLMEPAAYDIRAIGLMVGVDMPALEGEEDR